MWRRRPKIRPKVHLVDRPLPEPVRDIIVANPEIVDAMHKRYLLHVAGHNYRCSMRSRRSARPWRAETPAGAVLVVQIVLIVSEDGETAFAAICKPGQ